MSCPCSAAQTTVKLWDARRPTDRGLLPMNSAVGGKLTLLQILFWMFVLLLRTVVLSTALLGSGQLALLELLLLDGR